jgi:hypothetical protein
MAISSERTVATTPHVLERPESTNPATRVCLYRDHEVEQRRPGHELPRGSTRFPTCAQDAHVDGPALGSLQWATLYRANWTSGIL